MSCPSLARVEIVPEVPEQDGGGLVGEGGVFGPAEVGLAGEREVRSRSGE